MTLQERYGELSSLESLLAGCYSGTGGVAVVSGPVGSGKTELLDDLADKAASAGVLHLRATGRKADALVPLGVLTELFHSTELRQAARRVAELLDDAGSGGTLGESGTTPPPRLMHGLTELLQDLAAQGPLLITVDDCHYADAASVHCLTHFVQSLRSTRILLIFAESDHAADRHPRFRTELLRQSRCRWLHLWPLSADGVAAMVQPELDSRAAPAVVDATGGNPLLVRALLADHRQAARPGATRDDQEPAIGRAYGQAIVSCLHRVRPAMLAIARGIAVLGDAASPRRLSALLDLDVDAVTDDIREMELAGLLGDGRFRHPAAEAAVLRDIPCAERMAGHREAARLLHLDGPPATVVARHLVAAGHANETWAVSVLREAAELAEVAQDVDFAVACLELAAQACGAGAQESAVTLQLARAEWQRNPASAARHFDGLVDALRAGDLDRGHVGTVARALLWHGEHHAAQEVLTVAAEEGGADAAVRVHVVREQLRATYPEVLPTALQGRTPPRSRLGQQLRAASALTAVLTRGAGEESIAVATEVLRDAALERADLESIEAALLTLLYADRPDLAAPHCARIIEGISAGQAVTRRTGLLALQAEVALRGGDMAGAERAAREALQLLPPRGWGVAVGSPRSTLVRVLTATGRHAEAADQLAQPVPEAMFRTRHGLLYLNARGHHQLAENRLQPALADFQACGQRMRDWGMDVPSLVPWRSGVAAVHLRAGDPERARKLIEEQLARPGGTHPRTYGSSLRLLAAASDARHRPGLLRKAMEGLQACGDRFELAHTVADMSHAYQVLGELGRSRAMAHHALQLADECRAAALHESLLRQHPQPREKPAPAEPEATAAGNAAVLSEAERRVAELVSLGHTNREVAKALFITVSTVEQHLTRVYRKLSISRRADLPVFQQLHVAEAS
ncbi:AAA family ATPase [Micromonospora sp. CPCC 205711]|uniref:helix-turn-helix transcriptional regulator n=1 Tax=Micromonospora sp. CPCC 205547 TaxID=3122400 RepID=UPI002FF00E7A